MSSIATYLNQILHSVYGKDVRQAIHDAISECYDDVNSPALQTEAMQAAVQAKIDAGEMAALTIGDGTITTAKIADGAITSGKMASGVIPTVDSTLSVQGAAADAKAVGDALAAGGGGEGLSSREKTLLLALFRATTFNSSSASTAYETLEALWSDSPTPVPTGMIYNWNLKNSLIDAVSGITATLGGTDTAPTRDAGGVHFSASKQWIDFNTVYDLNRTYEMDIELDSLFGSYKRQRIFCAHYDKNTGSGAACIIHATINDEYAGWHLYTGSTWVALSNVGETSDYFYFDGRTLKVYVSSDHKWTIKSKPIGGSTWTTHLEATAVSPARYGEAGYTHHVFTGSSSSNDNCRDLTISALRVYEGEV